MKRTVLVLFLAIHFSGIPDSVFAQSIELVAVKNGATSRTVELPGEFQPFLSVRLHARIAGYVERVLVDRGGTVKEGDLLVELSAPEMKAEVAEAQSKAEAAEAERIQAQAQLAAATSTLDRLREAAKTPGAIAGNELVQAERQQDVARALLQAKQHAGDAARAALDALKTTESYLKVTAPFDGVVTERVVHPGALVGPNADSVLLELQQVSKLRLVVAVPEDMAGGVVRNAKISFRVPAYPSRTFSGTVARISHALDPKTRTMPVELDVANAGQELAPGMYAAVTWLVQSRDAGLLVPKTSVVTTTERTFVVRNSGGRAEWVNVRKESVNGDWIQIIGPLHPGDLVVKRATDEIREGTTLK
jgi:RND family efflux transporter MFP subunit